MASRKRPPAAGKKPADEIIACPKAGLSRVSGHILLALLAGQVGLQPFLTSTFVTREMDKRSVVLATEGTKVLMCAALLSSGGAWRTAGGSTLRTFGVAMVPAALYLIQNLAMQVAYQRLDSVTFNCLNQTKLLSTAVFLYGLLHQGQSPPQLLALAMLTVAAIILQAPPAAATGARGARREGFQLGAAACMLASGLSGLCAALTQMLLQGGGRNAYQLTLEMSLVTVPFLAADMWARPHSAGAAGWQWGTLLPVVMQAFGGVVVGMVTKHLGGIKKGFAIVGGLVLSGVVQSAADGQMLPLRPLVALALVLLSIWLHTAYPWRPAAVAARGVNKKGQ